MMQGDYCSNCRNWKLLKVPNRSEVIGRCRWCPPIGHSQPFGKGPVTLEVWQFPLTMGDDWCSEHDRIENNALETS